jgi:NAD(P)H-flavin reductase
VGGQGARLLSLIALELGVSSRLVSYLRKGEPVIVMGPTGAPTEIGEDENVLLLGGGLGNAVLFSIAKAMRANGNRVIYFAGYKRGEDLFKREEIEAATDQVIWSTDTGAAIAPGRPQDAHFRGNIVQAMLAYQAGELGQALVPIESVDRIIAIGSDRMMAAVKAARHGVLAPYLKTESHRHRQHQLADAVHDERSVRAVPAEARRPADRTRDDHLLVLQPGSGHGPCRLPEPGGAAAPEHCPGEAVEPLAQSPAPRPAARACVARCSKNSNAIIAPVKCPHFTSIVDGIRGTKAHVPSRHFTCSRADGLKLPQLLRRRFDNRHYAWVIL